MSVLPSLIAALERAGGERLVLRSGETPHVLAGGVRHDLGTTKVSVKALEALTEQILSPEARKEFAENNVVVEPLSEAVSPIPLVVGTHRAGDQIRIELRRVRSAAAAFSPVSAATPQAAMGPAETPAASPPPAADPIPVPAPAGGIPPQPDEPEWQYVAVSAAAAPEAPAQSLPEAEVVAAAAGTPEAVSAQEIEPPTEAAVVAAAGEALPVDEDTVKIPPPSFVEEPAAVTLAPAEPQAAIPPAVDTIDFGEDPDEKATDSTDSADADSVESEPPEVLQPSRPMKVVSIAAARTETSVEPNPPSRSDASALEYWIREAAKRQATALYLRAGYPAVVRTRQRVQPLSEEALAESVIDAVTATLNAGEDDWRSVAQDEWARELKDLGLVRCQAFSDDQGAGVVVHLSTETSASSLQKDIPRQVRRICEKGEGIVVVSAQTAADVMQMIAALAEATAQRRAGYLISIEPPNGLGHHINGILVSARRIAGTEQDVAAAIRRAVHEGPDILVVALASGLVTEEVVRAAQPGTLVIVGAVAPTAPRALEALLSRVDPAGAQTLRRSLAASFRCGFGYRALRGIGGGRAIVHDVMMGTPDVRTCLESADFYALESLQRSGTGGMRSLDAALAAAVHRGEITLRQAAGMAVDRPELVRLVRQAARERNRAARARGGDRGPGTIRAAAVGIASA